MLMSDSSVTRLYTPLEIWERKYKEGIKSTWAKHLDLLKVSLYDSVQFSSVQSLSRVQLFATPCMIVCTTQQSHCWADTLRKPEGKETRVPQCSSQHCLQ